MTAARTIFTIGHSTRPWEEFLELLQAHRIDLLVDVRSFPGSRRYPQFNRETMAGALEAAGIAYKWMPELGGRRKAAKDTKNTAWRHQAFRGYADYMQTPAFAAGLAQLEDAAGERRTAYMCSESLWWKCHRGLISDLLKSLGWTVLHITSPREPEEHPFTTAARVRDGRLSYAAEDPLMRPARPAVSRK